MSAVPLRWRLSPFARAPGFADWLILTAIVVVAVAAAFPLAWMALTSLMTPAETMRTPPVWIPATPSLDAYAKVADVIQAIEGPVTVTACSTEEGQCEQFSKCNVRDPLYRVREKILSALGECTIAELAADPPTPAPASRPAVLHTHL